MTDAVKALLVNLDRLAQFAATYSQVNPKFIHEAVALIESQAAELEEKDAIIARLTLRYSQEAPKIPGLHWIRTRDGIEYTHDFVEADFENGTVEQWYEDGALIAGPIQTPIFREQEAGAGDRDPPNVRPLSFARMAELFNEIRVHGATDWEARPYGLRSQSVASFYGRWYAEAVAEKRLKEKELGIEPVHPR